MQRNVRRGNPGRFIGYAAAAVLGSAAFAAAADIGTRVAYSGALGKASHRPQTALSRANAPSARRPGFALRQLIPTGDSTCHFSARPRSVMTRKGWRFCGPSRELATFLPASPCPKLDTGTSGFIDEAGAHTNGRKRAGSCPSCSRRRSDPRRSLLNVPRTNPLSSRRNKWR